MSESISDGQGADTVVATACGSESDVVTLVVLDKSLAQQSIVLDLGLAKRRSVASHDDQLSLATSEGLQGGLVAKDILVTEPRELSAIISIGSKSYLS